MPNLQYLAGRLPIGLVMLDRDRHVLSYSEKAATLFGAEKLRASLGKSIQAIHPEQSHSKIDWMLQRSENEEATGYAAMLITVPDRVLQLRVIRLHDAEGVSGYGLVAYDITELTSRADEGDTVDSSPVAAHQLVKLPVSTRGHIGLLDIDQVSYMKANGHYTQACTIQECYFCNMSLGQLESRLPMDTFVRVHRSYIVNLAYANELHREGDQFVICMKGPLKTEVPISRGNVPRVRQLLGV